MPKKNNTHHDNFSPHEASTADQISVETTNLDLNPDPHLEKHLTKQMQKSIKGVMKM